MGTLLNRRRYMGASGGGGTANLYVQDGLIAMYDGIENAGAGTHSASATTWVDLVSGKNLSLILGSANWGDKYFQFGTNKIFTADASLWGDVVTIEVVCTISSNGSLLQYKNDQAFYINHPTEGWGVVITTNDVVIKDALLVSTDLSSFSVNYTTRDVRQNNTLLSHTGRNNRAVVSTTTNLILGGRYYNGYRAYSDIALYCLRLYNRALTSEEIAANLAVDNIRFNLGLNI